MTRSMNRREFVTGTAAGLAGSALAKATPATPPSSSILNYNSRMEYRRLGKTGLMVSAVCLGGHWKRLGNMLSPPFKGMGASKEDDENIKRKDFLENRHKVVSRSIESGINYVDACSPQEILAYSKVLKGRRDKMYLGYSWHTKEPRFKEWRTGKRLVQGLDEGLKEAGLDYVDLWRISLPMELITDLGELSAIEEATMEALALAKKQGKARFTGVSSHNRVWLKSVIEEYPNEIQVVLFPYTADSKTLPDDSVFDAIKQHDVGVFGIKPFANNALFKGDGSRTSPVAADDDRRARLAIRYILGNPAITAPIPGLISLHQVDNVAAAVGERRRLDGLERSELDRAAGQMWARLAPDYQWLKNWEYV